MPWTSPGWSRRQFRAAVTDREIQPLVQPGMSTHGQPPRRSAECRIRADPTPTRRIEAQAAVDVAGPTGNKVSFLGGQQGDHIGDLLGRRDAAQRRGLPKLFDDLNPKLFQRNALFLGLGALLIAQPVSVDGP